MYWMMADSGALFLLPFLLLQHRLWRGARLRVFAVDKDVSSQRAGIEKWLKQARIPAELFTIDVDAEVVDEANAGRTMLTGSADANAL